MATVTSPNKLYFAASAGIVGVGSIVFPAGSVSASHVTQIDSPAGVGRAVVLTDHQTGSVCTHNATHSIRGEFGLSNGQTVTRTNSSPNVCRNYDLTGGSPVLTVTRVRACDPSGCSSWKNV